MAKTKKKVVKKVLGRGRPQLYPVNANQEKSIRSRFDKGQSLGDIATEMDLHPSAVLRIRRLMRIGQ